MDGWVDKREGKKIGRLKGEEGGTRRRQGEIREGWYGMEVDGM